MNDFLYQAAVHAVGWLMALGVIFGVWKLWHR